MRFITSRIYSSIARHVSHRVAHDLDAPMQIKARDESSYFIEESMLDSNGIDDRKKILLLACQRALQVDGCFCEFGVYKGETLRRIVKLAKDRDIHGFDSFDGLPERWRHGFDTASFRTTVPKLKSKNLRFHIGLFSDTLPNFIANLKTPIAFAHIDCDLYSSASVVLSAIIPRLAPGAMLLFDEYFNYPGWKDHEHRALIECAEKFDLDIKYIAYNKYGEQVLVSLVSRVRADSL